MKDNLNWSDTVLHWKFLTLSSLNWKETQIIWRGSPTDWKQLILEPWRVYRKMEKSREHVIKAELTSLCVIVSTPLHGFWFHGAVQNTTEKSSKGVAHGVIGLLENRTCWKEAQGDWFTQGNTVLHRICRSWKQWETGLYNMSQETNFEEKGTVWTFWIGSLIVQPPSHNAILWKALRPPVIWNRFILI